MKVDMEKRITSFQIKNRKLIKNGLIYKLKWGHRTNHIGEGGGDRNKHQRKNMFFFCGTLKQYSFSI